MPLSFCYPPLVSTVVPILVLWFLVVPGSSHICSFFTFVINKCTTIHYTDATMGLMGM